MILMPGPVCDAPVQAGTKVGIRHRAPQPVGCVPLDGFCKPSVPGSFFRKGIIAPGLLTSRGPWRMIAGRQIAAKIHVLLLYTRQCAKHSLQTLSVLILTVTHEVGFV